MGSPQLLGRNWVSFIRKNNGRKYSFGRLPTYVTSSPPYVITLTDPSSFHVLIFRPYKRSNLHLAPATHALYELCWSFLLPLSLSIIILGNPAIAKTSASSAMPNRSAGIIGPMRRVGLVFAIGAAGSLAGVGVAFRLANAGWGGALMLPRETAAKIAGAVAATYIGGSVNLFAVAAAVGLMGTTSAGGASLFGALAATDIFLMALYFSGLVAAHKTPLLHRVFPASDCNDDDPLGGIQQTVAPIDNTRSAAIYSGGTGITSGRVTAIARTFSMLALGSVVCVMGNALAKISPLPGTATMVVTLLTVGTTRLLSRLAPHWHAEMSRKAPVMAAVLLNVFFASVGASGRWAQVVGVAPAIFAFASVALGVHVIVVAAGTALLNRFCGAGLGIDDMIVASNANIGGPSTAATFAGLIGQDALIVPAAVWGTVGYAIATTLGVGVWVLLR